MLFCGLDFETSGLIATQDRITEIGWVIYDPLAKKPLSIHSELVWDKSYPPLTNFITELTGITNSDLEKYGIEPKEAIGTLLADIKKCTHVVAHNAPFDKSFLHHEQVRQGRIPIDVPWIDTSKDVPYPKNITTRKLVHLAAEHGFVNPMAHRAVTDVLTMLKILGSYDAQEVINWSISPTVKIKAMVTRENKDLAKERGYRWDSPSVAWFKEIKEFQLVGEIKESPFNVVVVETYA